MGLGKWLADKAERALLGDRVRDQGGMDEELRDLTSDGQDDDDENDDKGKKKRR